LKSIEWFGISTVNSMTTIFLLTETDGSVRVNLQRNGGERSHIAPAAAVQAVHKSVNALMEIFDCLNLPWELLADNYGKFLVADGRWGIRRTTRTALPVVMDSLAARPLRILFTACAPTDIKGLDYEKEEEAMLRIADRLGEKIHLDIAEAGSFDELHDLVSELKPHVVHLSGHGVLRDGIGRFCFEDQRGHADERQGPDMAQQLFAGRGVRLVFVSGCQSAQAGVAGLCQSLTVAGHVPLAIGWGASIAARKRLITALEIDQQMGNRAGKATALYQIGYAAWNTGHREIGILLVALCFFIESDIASGGAKETLKYLQQMAVELGIDEKALQSVIHKSGEHYQRDRGASLVQQAIKGV
jgi:hypothetical protein